MVDFMILYFADLIHKQKGLDTEIISQTLL